MLTLIFFVFNFSFVFTVVQFEIPRSSLEDRSTSLIALNTKLGTVIGYKEEVENRTFNSFYGLPFAESPVGKLRFRRSRLINRFPQNPYSALNLKPHCPQYDRARLHPNDSISEDCLYANIFTPDLKGRTKKGPLCSVKYPVMLYVYGGSSSAYEMKPSFSPNSSTFLQYSGDRFAAMYDTIFVVFNYRVGLLSTLYVDNEMTGNLALFDQNLAINWVKDNIGDYCGDAGRITLLGNSLGSMSTSIQILSKYSKNHIKNAIMQSGSSIFMNTMPVTRNEVMINSLLAINNWKCLNLTSPQINIHINSLDEKVRFKFFELSEERENLKEIFFEELSKNWLNSDLKLKPRKDQLIKDDYIDRDVLQVAKFISKYAVDVDCLQELTIEQILGLDKQYQESLWTFHYDFDFIDEKTFLDYELFNKLDLNPNLNLLIGGFNDESAKAFKNLKDQYPNNFWDQFNAPNISKDEAKEIIKKKYPLSTDDSISASKLADFYTDETKWDLPRGYFDAIVNLDGDYENNCPSYFFANYASMSANSVYTYHFTQQLTKHYQFSLLRYDLHDYAWMGGIHADELIFLLGYPFQMPEHFTKEDRLFSTKLMELWTSFARDGKMPNLQPSDRNWPMSNKHQTKPRFVELNLKYTREIVPEKALRCEQFWRPLLTIFKK